MRPMRSPKLEGSGLNGRVAEFRVMRDWRKSMPWKLGDDEAVRGSTSDRGSLEGGQRAPYSRSLRTGEEALGTGERLLRVGIERFEAVKVDPSLALHRLVHRLVAVSNSTEGSGTPRGPVSA
jgi:hypothetical protein